MKLYSNFPHLDLHGMDTVYSKILVDEFINDNKFMKNKDLIIIHGIGQGLVKKAVHDALKTNKLVESYKLDNFNVGCTIVKLK